MWGRRESYGAAATYRPGFQCAQEGRILGTGQLLVEQKLIHSAGLAGHIEDVVVDSAARGLGLGKVLIEKLKDIAFEAGCAMLSGERGCCAGAAAHPS